MSLALGVGAAMAGSLRLRKEVEEEHCSEYKQDLSHCCHSMQMVKSKTAWSFESAWWARKGCTLGGHFQQSEKDCAEGRQV